MRKLAGEYQDLIDIAPKPPASFLIYFKSNTVELTEASRTAFAEIERALADRVPCVVAIYGHTDTVGTKAFNAELSRDRAQLIYRWLLERNLELTGVTVESYGEGDLLIPTADEVPEPRNRRVEIRIY